MCIKRIGLLIIYWVKACLTYIKYTNWEFLKYNNIFKISLNIKYTNWVLPRVKTQKFTEIYYLLFRKEREFAQPFMQIQIEYFETAGGKGIVGRGGRGLWRATLCFAHWYFWWKICIISFIWHMSPFFDHLTFGKGKFSPLQLSYVSLPSKGKFTFFSFGSL